MPPQPSATDLAKFAASAGAVGMVRDGMRLGLGTGSTAEWMVRLVARRARREGLRLICVPTSGRTAALARRLGLSVVDLDQAGWLDLTIDGTDEFDPAFNLIKGGGGAHLREKIVAAASEQMVVIADVGKRVARLGAFPLPVEIIPFGAAVTLRHIGALLHEAGLGHAIVRLRADGGFRTDEGNLIADLHLGAIDDAPALAAALAQVTGVVDHGLFIGLCKTVVVGAPDGSHQTHTLGAAPVAGRTDPADALALIAEGGDV
jgi:ribose 5-phosphate isomerase A